MRPLLRARLCPIAALLLTASAHAADWSPTRCGAEPAAPKYDLTTRAGYNKAVKQANGYQQDARDWAACVIRAAHADQTEVSRAAQNRIAEIQTEAVARQQSAYARLAAQSAEFKSAAARLKK